MQAPRAHRPAPGAADALVPRLIGDVYAAAPLAERPRLLEHLMRPLGVLSLVAVAGGLFASLRFRSGWSHFHIRLEDTLNVGPGDVTALAAMVQQVSVETVDALGQMIAANPGLAASAAAVVLMQALRRLRDDSPATPSNDPKEDSPS